MEKVIGKSTKVSLNGFNIRKDNGTLLLFCGDEQISPFDENGDAMKVCRSMCICKDITNKKHSKSKR